MRNRVYTATLTALLVASAGWAGAALRTATVEFRTDDVELTSERSFSSVSVYGCTHLADVGEPDLPARLLRFVIPADASVDDVVFECGGVEELRGSHTVRPAQPRVATGQAQEWVAGSESVYSSSKLFPERRVEYLGDGYLGGYRIATVAVHPLQYEPASGRLLLARDVSVQLVLAPAADRSIPRGRVTSRSDETYRRMVASLVENPEDLPAASPSSQPAEPVDGGFSPRYTPSLEGSAVEYVVITSDEFEPLFTDFAEWKTRLGVPTVVRTIPWIEANYASGVDTPERIRMFIQDAYSSWGVTYVLLGGDTGVVPVRYVRTLYQGGEMIPADIYYSSLEGTWNDDGDDIYGEGFGGISAPGDSVDLYPDVFVGRAPVADIVELETFIEKCQSYVCSPDAHFTDRNLFLAEVLFPYDWESGPFSLDGASDIMEPIGDLFPGDLHLSKLYANNDPYPESHELGSAVSIDSLEAGYNIAFHVGHGNKDILRVSKNNYITMADMSSLSNTLARSSFIWLLDCTTAAVDYDCIAERAINNSEGGAVGAFGATRLEFPATSRDYLWEWVDLLYTDDVYNVGETCAMAKAAFASPLVSGGENSHRWTQMTLLLLGDPQLPLWTTRARSMSSSHAPTVTVGESVLTVTVSNGGPVEGALVTVSKDAEVYERVLTGPDGVADVAIRPDTVGTLDVAVTAQNHTPVVTTVAVLPASGPHLYVGAIGVDDDGFGESSGNGNGAAEAGELVEIGIEVLNSGTARVDFASAVLTTTDPSITITDGTEDIGAVVEGGSAVVGSAFAFTSSDTCPAEHDVTFTVEFSDSSRQTWSDDFTVRIHRPELRLYLMSVDDRFGNDDGVADPGELVTLSIEIGNDGTGEADDVEGVLTAPSGGATIVDGAEHWGDVAGGQSSVGNQGLDVLVGTDPSEVLSLALTDGHGKIWTCPLDLARPASPDSVWGTVRSTTIELAWTPVADADLRGYTVHRSLSQAGPFTQVNCCVIESGSFYADAGLEENTLYYYYVTAVDSSGNRSAQSEVLPISTNPPSLSGWPLSTGGGMYGSPAVADIDGDGSFEVFVASEHIYAWDADGTEILDGDGDPRTGGVFETAGKGGYRSSPAVGDIDGDVGLEVVAAAWADISGDGEAGTYEVYAWNAEDGTILPGWPVTTRKFCWASPALADLNNDGRNEVVIACADGYIYCWQWDGSELLDGDGVPQTVGPFASIQGSWAYGSTAVVDLDGDHSLELIQPGSDGNIHAFHADGSIVPGWPVDVQSRSMCSPAVGDVDGDGAPEIAVGSNACKFWLLRGDGSVMPGWPRAIATSGDFPPSPVLADVTGNGELEVVIAGKTGWVTVCDYEGNVLPGWPLNIGTDTYSSPVVADLDGDAGMEIAIGGHSGQVFAFDVDGELLAGWPIQTGAEVIGSPAVCDLDGDGDNEVVVGGMDTNVYIWDTAGAYDSGEGVEWGSFLHDAWRSQCHDFEIPTGVDDSDEMHAGFARCALEQNSPNPFNPVTTIGFTVPDGFDDATQVTLSIYSVDGSLVRTLVDGPKESGRHTTVWDGRDRGGNRVASGVYFYRLSHEAGAESRSMVLMK